MQFQSINGRTTSSVVYNFAITARKPGSYKIPAMTVVTTKGKQRTEALTLTVVHRPALVSRLPFSTRKSVSLLAAQTEKRLRRLSEGIQH